MEKNLRNRMLVGLGIGLLLGLAVGASTAWALGTSLKPTLLTWLELVNSLPID